MSKQQNLVAKFCLLTNFRLKDEMNTPHWSTFKRNLMRPLAKTLECSQLLTELLFSNRCLAMLEVDSESRVDEEWVEVGWIEVLDLWCSGEWLIFASCAVC